MAEKYTSKGANISGCGRYRYRLWREWRSSAKPEHWAWLTDELGRSVNDGAGHPLGTPKSAVFIMLNPSTADGELDDPTIRRCVGFAKSWGYDRLDVLNLFAYRTRNPNELLSLTHDDDPVGPQNRATFRSLLENDDTLGRPIGKIICAWGNHGRYINQDETVLGWLGDYPRYALRISQGGNPSHPLYLPAASKLVEFRP